MKWQESPGAATVGGRLSDDVRATAPMLQPAVIYVAVAEMHAFCRRAAARQPTRRLQGLASLRVQHCAPRGHSTGILSQHAQVPSLFVRNERACILGTWALKGMDNGAVGERKIIIKQVIRRTIRHPRFPWRLKFCADCVFTCKDTQVLHVARAFHKKCGCNHHEIQRW